MYYVPEGTKKCGYYQCERCGVKFLSLQTMNMINCAKNLAMSILIKSLKEWMNMLKKITIKTNIKILI